MPGRANVGGHDGDADGHDGDADGHGGGADRHHGGDDHAGDPRQAGRTFP